MAKEGDAPQGATVTELGPETPEAQKMEADRKEDTAEVPEKVMEKVVEQIEDGAGDCSPIKQNEPKDKNI